MEKNKGMKRVFKYALLLLAIALVGYKSVYFRKLSDARKATAEKFDAAAYSKKLWDERLPARLDSAIELNYLIQSIQSNPDDAFSKYSNAMGIGNYRYSLVKLNAEVATVQEDDITLKIAHADSSIILKLATEYVYGNAIRDASGLLDIRDFTNTSDLNSISEELNKIVRSTVLPDFKKKVRQGDKVEVTGAVEFNKAHVSFKQLEVIPVRLKVL